MSNTKTDTAYIILSCLGYWCGGGRWNPTASGAIRFPSESAAYKFARQHGATVLPVDQRGR